LQHDLGTTPVQVTQDQAEAMTLGHRVAVMNRGKLQQFEEIFGLSRKVPFGSSLMRRRHISLILNRGRGSDVAQAVILFSTLA